MRFSKGRNPRLAVRALRRGCSLRPKVGIILGSGFAGVADALDVHASFAVRDLPGFRAGAVPGHSQRLLMGTCGPVAVAALQGRIHYYEGLDLSDVTFPTRVLAELGIEILLATNAAGALNPRFRVGDFMAFSDHINFMGANPLRGPLDPRRPPFVDLTQAYDPTLQHALRRAARSAGARCHSGVYLAVSGPSYETPAEIRAFRRMGADAVGMSTVPEVIVARSLGIRVAGLSCLTNSAAGLSQQPLNHRDVLEVGEARFTQARELVRRFLASLE